MRVVSDDFVAAGKPNYIRAVAGVQYTDITTGIIYKQTTIPNGSNWVVVVNEQVYNGVSAYREINTSGPIVGGGNLTANRNLSILKATASQDGYLSAADWVAFNGKQGALVLTTTGTSGPSTLVGNTLNIPQYAGGGSGGSTWNVLIDGGSFLAPSDNTLIDGGGFV